MTLAPNADIAVAGGPGQGRAFSDQPARVTSAVKASVSAYRQAKVVAAPGPFPGDGAASQDPAEGPAPVGLSLDELRNADMKPFEAVATGDRAVPAIQMSNAIYAACDGVTPATLLPDAVDELRDRLGFQGAIVSADLVATTATTGGSVGAAAIDALQAGVDLLVVPGGRAQQDEAYRAVVAAVRSRKLAPERIADALGHIADIRALTKDSRNPLQAGRLAWPTASRPLRRQLGGPLPDGARGAVRRGARRPRRRGSDEAQREQARALDKAHRPHAALPAVAAVGDREEGARSDEPRGPRGGHEARAAARHAGGAPRVSRAPGRRRCPRRCASARRVLSRGRPAAWAGSRSRHGSRRWR